MKGLAVFLVSSALLWLCGAMPARASGPHGVFLDLTERPWRGRWLEAGGE